MFYSIPFSKKNNDNQNSTQHNTDTHKCVLLCKGVCMNKVRATLVCICVYMYSRIESFMFAKEWKGMECYFFTQRVEDGELYTKHKRIAGNGKKCLCVWLPWILRRILKRIHTCDANNTMVSIVSISVFHYIPFRSSQAAQSCLNNS